MSHSDDDDDDDDDDEWFLWCGLTDERLLALFPFGTIARVLTIANLPYTASRI